jgi:hypothetical protein
MKVQSSVRRSVVNNNVMRSPSPDISNRSGIKCTRDPSPDISRMLESTRRSPSRVVSGDHEKLKLANMEL